VLLATLGNKVAISGPRQFMPAKKELAHGIRPERYYHEFPFSILSPAMVVPLTSSECNGQSGFDGQRPH